MSDLFGALEPAPARPAVTAPEPAPERPAFGSHAWTHCPCGGFATLYFPTAGGIRRCMPCAKAEGRMRGPNDV